MSFICPLKTFPKSLYECSLLQLRQFLILLENGWKRKDNVDIIRIGLSMSQFFYDLFVISMLMKNVVTVTEQIGPYPLFQCLQSFHLLLTFFLSDVEIFYQDSHTLCLLMPLIFFLFLGQLYSGVRQLFHVGMNDGKFPAHPMNLWSFQKDPLGQLEEKIDNEVLLLWLSYLLNLAHHGQV